ncbi:hypothetical protein PENSPDRAFT_685540 [Peniophora sp. CONT]|nr:hypothetical protein PENSPDRAFT_685540 [Peniophora sp. CONT]
MVRVSCTICLEDNLDLSVFRNLPCGHAFCEPCITGHINTFAHQRTKPSCPQCRRGPIKKTDLRPVFLQFADGLSASQVNSGEDATEEGASNDALRKQLRHVKKGLDKLGPEAPLSSVEMAAEKIDAFRNVDDVVVLGQLVGAVASWFTTQGVRVYSEILELRSRIAELQNTHDDAALAHTVELDKRRNTIKGLRDDIVRLQNRLRGVEEREAAARAQASEVTRLRRECEEKGKRLEELAKNRDSLNAMLSQNKDKLQATSTKSKKYKAEAQQLQAQLTALQNEIAAQTSALQDSPYDEAQGESLVIGDYYNDFEESPRLQKRRRLDELDMNSSPTRGSSSSPPPRIRAKPSHLSSSPVPQRPGFTSDWNAPSHQTTKKLRLQESPKKSLPFPGIGANGRPTPKASLVLGSRMRMGKKG